MVSNQDIPLHRYTHLFMVDLSRFLLQFWTPPLLGTMRHVRAQVGSGSSWTTSTALGSETLQGSWRQQDSRKIRTSWRCCTSSQFIRFKFSQLHPGIPNSSEISTRTVETHVTAHVNDCKRWLISKITGRFLELPGVHRCGHPWPEV